MPNAGLMKLLDASDHEGGRLLVDPDFHASPQFVDPSAQDSMTLFRSKFLSNPTHNVLKSLSDMYGSGATEKQHFRVGGARDEEGRVMPSSLFMVKPYYEYLRGWHQGKLPLSGWAEMAWHGILHKSGLGPNAMNVHTFQYPNDKGLPLLAVELHEDHYPSCSMDPELLDGAKTEPWSWHSHHGVVQMPSYVKTNALKLATLDFLLNHQDRSGRNLMVNLAPANIPGTPAVAQGLLAIDNGRSMQYMSPNRFAERDNGVDHLFDYVQAPGYKLFRLQNCLGESMPTVAKWWVDNKPAISREFHTHVAGIKHAPLACHLIKSFADRAAVLDRVMSDSDSLGCKAYVEGMNDNIQNGSHKAQWSRASVPMRTLEE